MAAGLIRFILFRGAATGKLLSFQETSPSPIAMEAALIKLRGHEKQNKRHMLEEEPIEKENGFPRKRKAMDCAYDISLHETVKE